MRECWESRCTSHEAMTKQHMQGRGGGEADVTCGRDRWAALSCVGAEWEGSTFAVGVEGRSWVLLAVQLVAPLLVQGSRILRMYNHPAIASWRPSLPP